MLELFTYILVGDNVDFTIVPTHMRADLQKLCLHYFQSCAIKDRIDLSSLSSSMKSNTKPTLNNMMSAIRPSAEDNKAISLNFVTLISRILIDNMSYFYLTFSDLFVPHISHKYSKEMQKKSEVVSCFQVYMGP